MHDNRIVKGKAVVESTAALLLRHALLFRTRVRSSDAVRIWTQREAWSVRDLLREWIREHKSTAPDKDLGLT